mmetsp:Transcript_3098/g.8404  ORF Transcript_3098/g.8404 Transcript_3098/m.8404 type:complete len:251 (-) Transcript_3098:43-795(-)
MGVPIAVGFHHGSHLDHHLGGQVLGAGANAQELVVDLAFRHGRSHEHRGIPAGRQDPRVQVVAAIVAVVVVRRHGSQRGPGRPAGGFQDLRPRLRWKHLGRGCPRGTEVIVGCQKLPDRRMGFVVFGDGIRIGIRCQKLADPASVEPSGEHGGCDGGTYLLLPLLVRLQLPHVSYLVCMVANGIRGLFLERQSTSDPYHVQVPVTFRQLLRKTRRIPNCGFASTSMGGTGMRITPLNRFFISVLNDNSGH